MKLVRTCVKLLMGYLTSGPLVVGHILFGSVSITPRTSPWHVNNVMFSTITMSCYARVLRVPYAFPSCSVAP